MDHLKMAAHGMARACHGWLALVMLWACGAPEEPQHQVRPDAVMLTDRVVEWALGERARMVRKKSRAGAQLLVLPQQGAPRALLGHCVNARSLLPSSVNPQEVYVIVDGDLHVIDTSAPQPAPVPVEVVPDHVVLSELLAMSRRAPPVALLVLAHGGTDGTKASAPTVWWLLVEAGRARAVPIWEDAELSDPDTFFERFAVPRCRERSRDCLVIANGDGRSFLDVDSHLGGERREWRTLESTWIEDARWSPTDQTSALLLARCHHTP